MFKSILVATDLSEASDHVVACMSALRPLGAEKVVLLYCLGLRHIEDMKNLLIPLVQPKLNAQKSVLEKAGFQVVAEIAAGLPQFDVSRVAAEKDCSLIAVGSRGQTASDEIMLGGIASEVIHSAVKPVLILRLWLKKEKGDVCHAVACHPLEHVLFPTDFSDNAEHAFSYVEKIAESGVKRVTLLHVQDQGKIDRHLKDRLAEFNRIDTERLERLKAELGKRGVRDVAIELPYGSPKQEILNRTHKGDISLVVMGSQGRGYISEVFLGSVSHAVTRHSEASVLLIPAP